MDLYLIGLSCQLMGLFSIKNILPALLLLHFPLQVEAVACNTVHLHLNKTTFIEGEAIAFKSYVFDLINNKSVLESRNLFVFLLNSERDTLWQRKVLYKPLAGDDIIPTNGLVPGIYHIIAKLESLSGAQCGRPFVQELQVLGDALHEPVYKDRPSPSVELYPMGEGLVNGVVNNLVYRIKSYRELRSTVVQITSEEGKIVAKSSPKISGFGTLSFIPEAATPYFAEVLANSEVVFKKAIQTNSNRAIRLGLSKNRRKGLLSARVHRPENLALKDIDSVYLKISNRDWDTSRFLPMETKNKSGILLDLAALPQGYLLFELQDKGGVTLDSRAVFNDVSMKQTELEVLFRKRQDDSIDVHLFSKAQMADDVAKSFSVSILPSFSKALAFRKSIYNSAYINPYWDLGTVKELAEFSQRSERSRILLDYSISTQSASKIKSGLRSVWEGDITYTKGYRMTGFINNLPSKSPLKVVAQLPESGIWEETALKPNNSFVFPEIEVNKGEPLTFLLADRSGTILSKPVSFNYTILDSGVIPVSDGIGLDSQADSVAVPFTGFSEELFYSNSSQIDLEEVVITGRKLKYEQFVSGAFYGRKIDSTLSGFGDLETLMKTYGYNWSYIPPGSSSTPGRDGVVFVKSKGSGLKLFPTVIYNGKYYRDLTGILATPIDQIEEVYYNGGGMKGGGTFIIFGKEITHTKNASESFILEQGYETTRKYQLPIYSSYERALFHSYGQIFWSPQVLQQKGTGSAKLTFDGHGHKSFRIIIEGIDEYGNLYFFDEVLSAEE